MPSFLTHTHTRPHSLATQPSELAKRYLLYPSCSVCLGTSVTHFIMDFALHPTESDDASHIQVKEEDSQHGGTAGGALGGTASGAVGYQLPMRSPPSLTPHYIHPSSTEADFLNLINYLEQTRIQEDAR